MLVLAKKMEARAKAASLQISQSVESRERIGVRSSPHYSFAYLLSESWKISVFCEA